MWKPTGSTLVQRSRERNWMVGRIRSAIALGSFLSLSEDYINELYEQIDMIKKGHTKDKEKKK